MRQTNYLIILPLLLALTGCSSTTAPVYVETPKPPPVTLKPLIMHPVDIDVVSDGDTAYLKMDFAAYENLSLNFNMLVDYIKKQKIVIEYYDNN